MTLRQSAAVILLSAATTAGSVWGIEKYQQHQQFASDLSASSSIFKNTRYANENAVSGPMVDFEKAATKAAPAVVHIKTLTKSKQVNAGPDMQDNPFKDFFGDDLGDMFGGRGGSRLSPEQRASGSGVAISADGYIVTNNHVVDGADELIVTLNNKKDYKAKVIGKDPSQ
ncbi:MAG: trypsin-like peptidase domain-containing protein [Segetibacter sp.]